MCNIAGYVGAKAAAPILIDMIRKQEGLNGGYYTGIATMHEGKIYYAKLTGDLQRLLDETDAANFPGNIGIIHSRTKSGGGDEWAHPFVGKNAEGDVVTAYIANGAGGFFKDRLLEFAALTEQLISDGYPMNHQLILEDSKYPKLSDGTSVHLSDSMCQLILRNMDRGMTSADAMEAAFCEMPSEIVGLLLSLSEPECISWSRINMPVHVAFASHGVYLSSTPTAIPTDSSEPVALPANSGGKVYCDKVETKPYKKPVVKVAELSADVRIKIYQKICEELKNAPIRYCDLSKAVKPLFEEGDICPTPVAVYEVLYALQKQGVLNLTEKRVPGVFEGLEAPQVLLSLD